MKSDIHRDKYSTIFSQEDIITLLSFLRACIIPQIYTLLLFRCCLGICMKHVDPNSLTGTGNSRALGHVTFTGSFPPNTSDGIQFIQKVIVNTPSDQYDLIMTRRVCGL